MTTPLNKSFMLNQTISSKSYFNPIGSANHSRKQTPVSNYAKRTPTSIHNTAPTSIIKQENIDKNIESQLRMDRLEQQLRAQSSDTK